MTTTDIQAAVNAGINSAAPAKLETDVDLYAITVPEGGELVTVDVQKLLQPYQTRPRRKTGTVHVHTADSFIDYLKKHGIPETEVWADTDRTQLVAVINAHQESVAADDATAADRGAGYGDHRVSLALVKTPEWLAWEKLDRKYVTQQVFAEHIEDNALDIVVPDSATMLEIAESFQASTRAEFKGAQRLHSGQVTLQYSEEVGARAGENGDIEIPTTFTIQVIPFEGHKHYEVEARFRYRIRGGELVLSYHLVRPHDVLHQAFLDYVNAVDNEVSHPLFRGRPE